MWSLLRTFRFILFMFPKLIMYKTSQNVFIFDCVWYYEVLPVCPVSPIRSHRHLVASEATGVIRYFTPALCVASWIMRFDGVFFQDNVSLFLKACGKLGLNVSQLFHPGDLQDLSTRATFRWGSSHANTWRRLERRLPQPLMAARTQSDALELLKSRPYVPDAHLYSYSATFHYLLTLEIQLCEW